MNLFFVIAPLSTIIGVLIVGRVVRNAGLPLTWKTILLVSAGWAIAELIIRGFLDISGGLIIGAISGAIVGAVGGTLLFIQIDRARRS